MPVHIYCRRKVFQPATEAYSFYLSNVPKGLIPHRIHPSLLPYRFVTIELYKNYDDANVAALNALSGESQNLLTNLGEVSVSDVQEKIRSREQEILNKKQELDAIKKEQEQRIEEFKRKLEEEYRKQNELIEKKKAELEEKVRDLNNQLYMLETEIYAIRCITGEVVNFTKLTDGRNADAPNPCPVFT